MCAKAIYPQGSEGWAFSEDLIRSFRRCATETVYGILVLSRPLVLNLEEGMASDPPDQSAE